MAEIKALLIGKTVLVVFAVSGSSFDQNLPGATSDIGGRGKVDGVDGRSSGDDGQVGIVIVGIEGGGNRKAGSGADTTNNVVSKSVSSAGIGNGNSVANKKVESSIAGVTAGLDKDGGAGGSGTGADSGKVGELGRTKNIFDIGRRNSERIFNFQFTIYN